MTPFVWMFIKTYEKLRNYIIQNKSIATLIQMEYSAYEEATVPICTFVLKNGAETQKGLYFRLSDFKGGMEVQRQKMEEAIANHDCGYFYEATASNFSKIPGRPIAYWVKQIYDIFENSAIMSSLAKPKQGMSTGDVNKFLRLWEEVDMTKTNLFNGELHDGWIRYNKGGEFRRWYGNREYVVYWGGDGTALIKANATLRNKDSYFVNFIAWSKLSSSGTGFRNFENEFLFDGAGGSLFVYKEENKKYILGLLNTVVITEILKVISPTINYNENHIGSLPVIIFETKKDAVEKIVDMNISTSKSDWDSYETSWDFKKHPLI